MSDITRAEICVVACAEAWRGDGEIVASPIGTIPMIAVRLAASTFEPDLLYTDGDALLLAEPMPVGAAPDAPRRPEAWLPFGKFFDVVWSGKRHVMMGATQIDRFGNQNIACIGPWAKPKAMLLGVRGGPGNTAQPPDELLGAEPLDPLVRPRGRLRVGRRAGTACPRARSASTRSAASSSNLAVLDFETPDHSMRLRSVHPGVTVDEVDRRHRLRARRARRRARDRGCPTDEELRVIREVLDPNGLRDAEVKTLNPHLRTAAVRPGRHRGAHRADGHGLGERARAHVGHVGGRRARHPGRRGHGPRRAARPPSAPSRSAPTSPSA